MNMMKNANNTIKTKLLTLVCKELRDGNESIAITNHYTSFLTNGCWALLDNLKPSYLAYHTL